MRWPWGKPETRLGETGREKRSSGGDFTDAVVRLIEAQAAGTAVNVSSTAAIEAMSGLLSRNFAAAQAVGVDWLPEAVSPVFLGQVGRDLIRGGASMHIIDVVGGVVSLLPVSSWHFQGDSHPDTWMVRATTYGPSSSTTTYIPYNGVVFIRWGSTPGLPYVGTGPTSWANTTARLNSATEKSLADESANSPLAHLITIPQDGGDDDDANDPLAKIKADIRTAQGKALFVETVAGAWGEGRAAAPQRDWQPSRLGPMPPDSMVNVMKESYAEVLAACGGSPALFDDSDGTAKREALRQFHMGTVRPLAHVLEVELTAKLETAVTLKFDAYALDMAGRASSFKNLVAGGMEIEKALAISGLMQEE